MEREAIILAGGLGTRLQSVLTDIPKCMAPINGKPFISYLLEYLKMQGIKKFIFALGFKSKIFEAFLSTHLSKSSYALSIENEPLGTGGAIKLACTQTRPQNVLIINGDTFFKIKVNELFSFHNAQQADCTLSLKPMQNFSRYGVVELNNDDTIKKFNEKKFNEKGLINGGVYILKKDRFLEENLPDKFSFEKDYLEKFYESRKMVGLIQHEYFIDIGIPEDYAKASKELIKETE